MRIGWLLAVLWVAAPAQAQYGGRGLNILEAHYGVGDRLCDATRSIQRACQGLGECRFDVDNGLCGDPARRESKALAVVYSCGRGRGDDIAVYPEGARGELTCERGGGGRPPSGERNRLQIDRVLYGVPGRTCDATPVFASECNGRRRCEIEVNNRLCGDPARNRTKTAEIAFWCNGRRVTGRVAEGRYATLTCP